MADWAKLVVAGGDLFYGQLETFARRTSSGRTLARRASRRIRRDGELA
jgi:hypothetical protein